MDNIMLSNPKEIEKIKKQISKGGVDKFHVIADFDRTLTKEFVDGKRIPSVISILRDGSILSSDYDKKAHELFNKYHPIETNPNLSLEDKKKAMHEWWKTHFELLIKSGLNKKDLEKVVDSNKIQFRKGANNFMNFLHNKHIPLLIFSSAGIGDTIQMLIKKRISFYDNIHVITNIFEWDEKGNAISVKKPIIHSMNKDETLIQNHPSFGFIKNRKNVILLWDSIGDIGMVKGFDYDNLIKIGFLNDKIEENLELYKENFDIVLLNDSSMDYVNELLKELFK
jgi:5'-nucleotidase